MSVREGDMWDCRHHHICYDESKILFAWAKHAEPTELPQDVGFALADDDHLVLQVIVDVVVFVRSVPDPYRYWIHVVKKGP